MKSPFLSFLASLALLLPVLAHGGETLNLAGEWRFAIGAPNAGLEKTVLQDRVTLPGTTQTNQKGRLVTISPEQQKVVDLDEDPDRNPLMGIWTPAYANVNSAWYQRDVEIPASWANQRITLTLDRSKITRVWVDEQDCGSCDDICTSHCYDLTKALTPGKHRLTVLVTTGPFPYMVVGHQLGAMQGNWNGIIGRIQLEARPQTFIEEVRVTPDVARKVAKLRVAIANPAGGSLEVSAKAWNTDQPHSVAPMSVHVTGTMMEFDFPLGKNAQLWDEFHPALYKLTARLGADSYVTDFGLREFRRKATVFTINGKTTFLRGTNDCAQFPKTLHAPGEVEEWVRIWRILKSYGLNHCRFHTWTPPEAAFTAADMVGIYMQPELPSVPGFPYGENKEHDDYELRMGFAMLRKWANHPSFVMLALGNEIGIKNPGNRDAMTAVVNQFRAFDPTRLYAEGSNNNFGQPTFNPNDDYWTTMFILKDAKRIPIRASFSGGTGWLNTTEPSTLRDYTGELKVCPAPMIGHEVGQYTFYPDLNERLKYTGNVVARLRNFDVIENRMRARHILEQNQEFARASGALAALCYREEIEAYLRTPNFGGFQMLDLVDYHGQGTSLVGVLDAFRESKGIITPEQWRQFCSETVVLCRFPKYTWTTGETFTAEVQVAHYGPQALANLPVRWSLAGVSGQLPPATVATGTVQSLGKIQVPLGNMKAPQRVQLEAQVGSYRTEYPLWVYPAEAPQAPNVTVIRKLDAALAALEKGEKVLFIPELKDIEPYSLKSGFETVFWNFFFGGQPPTMGILCDPKHPMLAQFPTEFHSNWQWFPIVTRARVMILDALPAQYRPVVQAIDNIQRCRKLGLIWEAKVGPGKLLVCTSDLPAMQDQPAARQLLQSITQYVTSEAFAPQTEIPAADIQKLFTTPVVKKAAARKDE